MDAELSSDLWILIASGLPIADVSRLGRCSRTLLQILRPILFRTTTLREKSFEMDAVALLGRDSSLAGCVKHFSYPRKIFGMIEAILNMTSLTKLVIGISFEDNEEGQESFVSSFKTRDMPLEELVMYGSTFAAEEFDIPRLKRLTWNISARKSQKIDLITHNYNPLLTESQLGSVLSASRETLEQLVLPARALRSYDDDDPFWELRFPSLRELHIDSFPRDIFIEHSDRANFFLAHVDTLKDIRLDRYPPVVDFRLSFCIPNDKPAAEGEAQKRMRHRQAQLTLSSVAFNHNWSPVVFPRCIPDRVKQLERLEVIDSPYALPRHRFNELQAFQNQLLTIVLTRMYENPQCVAEMERLRNRGVDAKYANWNVFPVLREVDLPIWGEHHTISDWTKAKISCDEFTDYLRQVAHFFGPTVEVFSGSLPPIQDLTAERLGETLNYFPKLKHISICDVAIQEGGFDHPITGSAEDYILQLASICTHLEKVDIKDTKDRISSGLMLRIDREERDSGRLVQPRIVERKWVKSFRESSDF